jgi:hypothetical protein
LVRCQAVPHPPTSHSTGSQRESFELARGQRLTGGTDGISATRSSLQSSYAVFETCPACTCFTSNDPREIIGVSRSSTRPSWSESHLPTRRSELTLSQTMRNAHSLSSRLCPLYRTPISNTICIVLVTLTYRSTAIFCT